MQGGMVLESDDERTYIVNPAIRPLAERENTHSLAIRVVRGGGGAVRIKPVFNSGMEFRVYRVLLALFPNMLVFSNISLQSAMPFEAMRLALSKDDFEYYLKASADYGIVSTATYLPIVCVELDSPWHDTERQATRDARKDRVFEAAGLPLVRLRVHGDMSDDVLRHEVVAGMSVQVNDLRHVADRNPFAARGAEELETARTEGRWGGD